MFLSFPGFLDNQILPKYLLITATNACFQPLGAGEFIAVGQYVNSWQVLPEV